MKYMYYKSNGKNNKRIFWRVDNNFKIEYYTDDDKWYRIHSSNYFSTIFKDNINEDKITKITKQEFDNHLMIRELVK